MASQKRGRAGEALGPRLRRLREAAGLTQLELAEAAGLTQPAVSELERGLRGLSIERAVDVARALGVSVGELAGEGE